MDRYLFAVGEEAYCCWEYDLLLRNERFLKALDAEYFSHLVERHLDQLDSDEKQRAAVSLRVGYHHGAETLFSLLGAMAQAPEAVPAWLPKCSTSSLRAIVKSIANGHAILTQRGRQAITFAALSGVVHQFCWQDESPANATADRFASFWARLAGEFLDNRNIAEYNSLKHGFRIAAGGFILRIGEETEPGVRAPEANMETIGASPFGTSFYDAQPIVDRDGLRHHFRIRHTALNWRAEAMAQRLQLITWSINNVVGALRCLNGAPPGTVRFLRPEDPAIFDAAWQWDVGVHASDFDVVIEQDRIDPIPRAALKLELEQRTAGQNGPRQ